MSFRPRRRTASTSGCSSRACTLHGASVAGGGVGGGAGSTKSPPLVINHNHLSNRMEAADLIERCSSNGSRSMASSPSMSVQPLTASAASAASASNSEVTEGPRVKKISLEEAQQFRKEVLDPQFSEANEEMAVFISGDHVTYNEDHEVSQQGEYNAQHAQWTLNEIETYLNRTFCRTKEHA